MRAALTDPALLGNALPGPSWQAWRILLIAAMGEKLTPAERKIFKQFTGREREPGQRVEELAAVVGRRGGKSKAMATLACYIGTLCEHKLVHGEKGVLLLIAPDQRQASIALSYAVATSEASPILSQLIVNRTADTLELSKKITLEVRAASFRRLRGPTFIAVIADEAAFWFTDEFSSNADAEILRAVRPGLATTGGPLIIASSPYARRGEVWSIYHQNYGPDGDPLILVAQGASRDFNPSLAQSVVDRAYARDPAAAGAEFGAEFRTDLESFVSREVVDACVVTGRYELPPMAGVRYSAFVDPSGGSSDSMTLAIAHKDKNGNAILDAVRERRPPFSPDAVVREFATLLESYNIRQVVGDHYGGEFVKEPFRTHGIQYERADRPKSDYYRDALPLLNSGKTELLDAPRLISQLCGLERRVGWSGKDSINHGPGGHDDVINAVAGALVLTVTAKRAMVITPAVIARFSRPDSYGGDLNSTGFTSMRDLLVSRGG
jgi:hypothetical protein